MPILYAEKEVRSSVDCTTFQDGSDTTVEDAHILCIREAQHRELGGSI